MQNANDLRDIKLGWLDYYHMRGFVVHAVYHGLYGGNYTCACEEWRRKQDPGYVCRSPGKHIVGKWKDATPDEAYQNTRKHLYGNPGYGLGIRTGFSGKPGLGDVICLDIDSKEGKVGLKSYQDLCRRLVLTEEAMATATAVTGSGGYHMLFRTPDDGLKVPNSAGKLGVDLDVRGHGGFIVVAPSLHPTTQRAYEWSIPPEPPAILPLPPALLTEMRKGGTVGAAATAGQDLAPPLAEVRAWVKRIGKKGKFEATAPYLDAALKGEPFPFKKGAGNGAFLLVCNDLAHRWPNADAVGLLEHFRGAIEARQAQSGAGTTFEEVADMLARSQESVRAERAKEPWRRGYIRNVGDDMSPKPTLGNVMLALGQHSELQEKLAYNLRSNQVYWKSHPSVIDLHGRKDPIRRYPAHFEEDSAPLAAWLQSSERLTPPLKVVDEAVRAVARANAFDPVRQWLDSLPAWDGYHRIHKLLQGVGGTPDGDWVRIAQKRWFISLVARILRPGCKVDTMLVLEGGQGFKKSSFFKALFPERGWFSDSLRTPDLSESTVRQLHSGPVIFEIAEMQGFKAAEIANIKAFLSAEDDQLRPLYKEHRPADRSFIIVGTTNDSAYLHDATGGRRFWPISIESPINVAEVVAFRDQLFAEARVYLDDGERWWLTDEEEAIARREQVKRYDAHPWEAVIEEWLEPLQEDGSPKMPGAAPKDFVTIQMVFEGALKIDNKKDFTPQAQTIIRNILLKLGWIKTRKRLQEGRASNARHGFARPNK
jgi:predicted P-loop ATPase